MLDEQHIPSTDAQSAIPSRPLEDVRVEQGRRVFHTRLALFLPTTEYIETPDDTEVLTAWKQQIDRRIAYWSPIAECLRADPKAAMATTEQEMFRDALTPDFTERNITLFCIAEHLLELKPQLKGLCFGWRNIFRMVLGGTRHVTQLGRKRGRGVDNCNDYAVMAGVLARMYGIEGEILGPPDGHVFWHERSDDPRGGACIDVPYAWRASKGFLRTLGDHPWMRNR